MIDTRNSKWFVPAFLAVLFLLITRALLLAPWWLPWGGWLSGMGAIYAALTAVFNLYDMRRSQDMWLLERRQNALAHTPLVARIEAARGVNPEVVKIMINEERRVWMLKSGMNEQGPHSVLYGAPDVTEYFLIYFLESSTEESVMPKRVLSEGRKNRFDPWGVVDEYTMYDKLITLLTKQRKIHRWSEFDLWEWEEPWTPQLVATDYGVEIKTANKEEVIEDKINV